MAKHRVDAALRPGPVLGVGASRVSVHALVDQLGDVGGRPRRALLVQPCRHRRHDLGLGLFRFRRLPSPGGGPVPHVRQVGVFGCLGRGSPPGEQLLGGLRFPLFRAGIQRGPLGHLGHQGLGRLMPVGVPVGLLELFHLRGDLRPPRRPQPLQRIRDAGHLPHPGVFPGGEPDIQVSDQGLVPVEVVHRRQRSRHPKHGATV